MKGPCTPERSAVLAIVDIGSNTLKFSTVEIGARGTARSIDAWVDTVRLASGLDRTGAIDESRFSRALQALIDGASRGAENHATEFIGVATEAFRRADNGVELLERILVATPWKLRVIDGTDEAELAFRGIRHHLQSGPTNVVVDVGGASTEIMVADGQSLLRTTSLPIGSTVLFDRVPSEDPPSPGQMEMMREVAGEVLGGELILPKVPGSSLFVSGGTGEFPARLWYSVFPGTPLDVGSLSSLRELFFRFGSFEVAARTGIPPERARVLPAGFSIVESIAAAAGPQSLDILPSGLRNGILLDHLERAHPGRSFSVHDVPAGAE